jgi:Arc/MetJ-type ribon-helix-helix transcriptional regulator
MSKQKLEYLGIKIPRPLKDKLTQAVERGEYVSQSDLVRAAIRNLLDKEV